MRDVASLSLDLPEADCLLVVPPLAHLHWPALGVHQLQASAREAGFEVRILYASVLFAALVGAREYVHLANAPMRWLLGDRLFARAAFGAPRFGWDAEAFLAQVEAHNAHETQAADVHLDPLSHEAGEHGAGEHPHYPIGDLHRYEEGAAALVDALAHAIVERDIPVVGATSSFDQTAAGVALAARLKALRPEVRTLMGGANCEGEMALGVRSATDALDHVFSGESEATFVRFLQGLRDGAPPAPPVVHGAPCRDMDALPTPRYDDYFDPVRRHLPEIDPHNLWVSYETSRGCWWGQKHHCTFCGLNGEGMAFREKSPARVIAELKQILGEAPTHHVNLTDNIMPHGYHKSLIPRLASEVGHFHFSCEQKANLSLAQVKGLWDAGTRVFPAGVEALDSDLLRLMRKGVLARQNIAVLRYGMSLNLRVDWNLLTHFPGDDAGMYRRTLDLLPKIRHLWPPHVGKVVLDRFSPYHDDAEAFGIRDLAPADYYEGVFPPGTDLRRLAYHFQGTFESGARAEPALMAALDEEVARWRAAWSARNRPALAVSRAGPDRYVLVDTRGLGTPPSVFLSEAQARTVLVGRPKARGPIGEWALRNHYVVDLDGWYVPLAVAPYDLLAELEAQGPARAEAPLTVVGFAWK